MAMTSADIHRLPLNFAHRAILMKVNDGTATTTDIMASQGVDLHTKDALRRFKAGGMTRRDINAMPIDLPTKQALLAIAGV